MSKYIIYSRLDTRDSGGVKALYELASTLKSLGEEAYIVPWDLTIPTIFESKLLINGIPIAPPNIIDTEKDIIVYPEVVSGNPLQGKNVVRWILCALGKIGHDRSSTWDEQDLWMYWGDFTSASSQPLEPDKIMYVFGLEDRWLGGEPQESRHENYFLTRKARSFHQAVQKLHPDDAIHLDAVCRATDDYLMRYKKGRLLVSYDPYSFHAILSALAGCSTIVHPLPGVSREEWVRKLPAYEHLPTINNSPFMPGVAYGPEEVNLARQTSPLLWPTLQKQNQAGRQTVERFVETSKEFFRTKASAAA